MTQNQDSTSAREHTGNKHILVVEDHLFVVKILEFGIRDLGYHVISASNCSEALKAVKYFTPDLFVLDYFLPEMNGIELYEKLHAMEELKNVPAIILSTSPSLSHRDIKNGKIVVISKPFNLKEYLAAIEELIK